jgi:hypothetical protein
MIFNTPVEISVAAVAGSPLCSVAPSHGHWWECSWMRLVGFTLFVWSGVVDGALLCGLPRRLAPVDSRVPYTVTTSRSTSGQHTAAPEVSTFGAVRRANTRPTAVAADHSRPRVGIRAHRPSESSLDVRCQLLPGRNPPALPCFPQALQQGDRARIEVMTEGQGGLFVEIASCRSPPFEMAMAKPPPGMCFAAFRRGIYCYDFDAGLLLWLLFRPCGLFR